MTDHDEPPQGARNAEDTVGVASPRISATELGVLAVVAIVLAIIMSWPLLPNLTTAFPDIDFSDPALQAWQVAWGGHSLATDPTGIFHSNSFWPLPDTLAFSDALLGYAPAGLVGSGPEAALIRYNLLYLFAYVVAFAGSYLLAREVGARPGAAAVAAAVFTYAPWKLSQNTHLHVISSGGIPLSLFLLLRGYKQKRPGMIFAGWVVVAWQVSIGFTLGLQLVYLLPVLGAIALILWIRRPQTRPTRAVVVASLLGVVALGAWGALQARPYLRVAENHPEAVRTVEDAAFFSPPMSGLITVPEESRVWGGITRELRERLPWPTEQALFPGVIVLVLAIYGLLFGAWSWRLRLGLGVGVVVTMLLSLGFRFFEGKYTYALLYHHAPGWQGIRTPGRITTLTLLALGLLAASAIQRLMQPEPARDEPDGSPDEDRSEGATGAPESERRNTGAPDTEPRTSIGAHAVAAVFLVAILLEGSGNIAMFPAPPQPEGQVGLAAPQLHLPIDGWHDAFYMWWSTDGFPKIVNGNSGFRPAYLSDVLNRVTNFPDKASVRDLRARGVRSVVLHPDFAYGSVWQDAATRPIKGLGITRTEGGGVVVYDLGT